MKTTKMMSTQAEPLQTFMFGVLISMANLARIHRKSNIVGQDAATFKVLKEF